MIEALRDDIISDHVGHAYLLYGNAAEAEAEAYAFAAALNCLSPEKGEACGECRHCLQLKAGNFPDLIVLEPEKVNYTVGQFRTLMKYLSLTAKKETYRVFWFKKADHFTEDCVGFFLKSLEEPVPGTVFLLTAENEDKIYETISSRCRVLHLPRRFGVEREKKEDVFQTLCLIKQEPMEYLFRFAEKYTKENGKEELAAFFSTAAVLFDENYRYRHGGEAPRETFPAERWSEDDLFAAWQWAISAPVLLNNAISQRLILENFLLCIKRNGGFHGNCSWCSL